MRSERYLGRTIDTANAIGTGTGGVFAERGRGAFAKWVARKKTLVCADCIGVRNQQKGLEH